MSPKKWIEGTGAIGIQSKAGRYGGTFAHHIIAFEFLSWVSPSYKLFFMEEYERLKSAEIEAAMEELPDRKASKVYFLPDHNLEPIFTAPPVLTAWQPEYEELSDEDIVNVALFGITQGQFRQQYPAAKGTVHNNSAISLIITHNALQKENNKMAQTGVPRKERFEMLNRLAMEQAVSQIRIAGRLLTDSADHDEETPVLDSVPEQALAGE